MTASREIRARLSHPVIDADGHQLEFEPLLLEYLREVGGGQFAARSQEALRRFFGWYQQTPAQRREGRAVRPPWGLQTARVEDIAACMVPALFRSRMDEIDLAIIGESARWGRGKTRDNTWLPVFFRLSEQFARPRRC